MMLSPRQPLRALCPLFLKSTSLLIRFHFNLNPLGYFAGPSPGSTELLSNLPLLNLHLTYQEHLKCMTSFSSLNHFIYLYLLCFQVAAASELFLVVDLY